MKYSLLGALLSSLILSSCASKIDNANHPDPLDKFNRSMFHFNTKILDPYVLKPVAIAWKNTVPTPVRSGIGNVISNFNEPVSMVNNLLMGNFKQAITHFHRFALNSTFGLGGLIDFASYGGLEKNTRVKFGSVLGHYGMGYGPYMVLPAYGQATPRESLGGLVDSIYPPLSWLSGYGIVLWVMEGIEMRSQFLGKEGLLMNSKDPYTMARVAYYQNKDFQAQGGKARSTIYQNSQEIEEDLEAIDAM